MRNLLVILLVVPLVSFGAAKGYLWYQVKSGMDEFVKSVAPFAEIKYGGVVSSFDGSAGVEKLEITPMGMSEALRIGSIKVKLPDFLALVQLKDDLKKGKFPEELQFSVDNLDVDLDASYIYTLDQSSRAAPPNPFATDSLGCGTLKRIGAEELRAMGYTSFYVDFDMGYDFSPATHMLQLSASSSAQDLFDSSMVARVDLGVGSLSTGAMLGVQPRLVRFEINYADRDYNERRNRYCAKLNKESVKLFLNRHVGLVAKHFRRIGIKFSDDVVAAYSKFSSGPGTLKVAVTPSEAVDLATLPMYSPRDIISLLNIELTVNNELVENLDLDWNPAKLAKLQNPQRQSRLSAPVERSTKGSAASRPGENQRKRTRVATKNLGKYRGFYVSIVTRNGRSLSGSIVRVSSGTLTINRRLRGGTVTYPIRLSDIKEAYVRR